MDTWSWPLCPAPPEWCVAWDEIERRCAWLGALAGVPQEPKYHGEGDVLCHTRMVAEALAGLETWRALDAADRSALFLAALLHDIGKPACTQVAADGRVSSPRHAQVGARLARTLFWTGDGALPSPPFLVRERIARLVRHHGLPLWFLEKADPARALIAASQTVRLDEVALVAEADVRGRICADQAVLLERVALFRTYAEELGCASAPYRFPTAHSRFVYFARPASDPAYTAYDDTRCEVVLLSGLPGAGKDTWVRAHCPDLPIISLDALRAELGVAPTDGQGAVVRAAKERARALLREGRPFVWNATNVTRALRGPLIALFAGYHARVHLVYVDAPYHMLRERNALRERPIPEHVIAALGRKLEVPDPTEAQRVTWVYDEGGQTMSRELASEL